MYTYRATVERVVDGDTVDVSLDLGFSCHARQRLRLYGINAPETRGPEKKEGKVSKQFLIDLLPVGSPLCVETTKDKQGKFGRYVARIYIDSLSESVNDHMVTQGMAVYKNY